MIYFTTSAPFPGSLCCHGDKPPGSPAPPPSLIFTGIRRRTSYSILSAFLVRGTKTQPVLWTCRRTRRPNSSPPRDRNVSICPKHQRPHPHGQPQSHRHPTAPPGRAQESVPRLCCNPPGLGAATGTTSHGQRGAGPPARQIVPADRSGLLGGPCCKRAACRGARRGCRADHGHPTTSVPPRRDPPAAAPGETGRRAPPLLARRGGDGARRNSPAASTGHGARAAWKPLGRGGQSLTARGFLLAKPVTNVFAREQTARKGRRPHLAPSSRSRVLPLPATLRASGTTRALASSTETARHNL